MTKRIVMIYPEIPVTYWSFNYTLSFIGKKASIPPLGLMTVASMLPEDWDVNLIDMNVTDLNRNDLERADLVFISAMLVQKPSFSEVVRLCNEMGKPVVAGGPYPICSYENIEGVDHFILDEAELTLPAFLRDLEAGCPQRVYRDKRKPDITKTPLPRFDLIDVDVYISMPLQYSRGCPFNCEFCDIIEMFGRIPRTKTPEQFVSEMEEVYRTGFSGSIFIVDDNFVGNKRKVKALLRRLIEWQRDHEYPYALFTEASMDLAQDDELLDLMVEASFEMVFLGIETPDKETLVLAQKKQNLRSDIYESIKKIQKKGIEVAGGFIIGFDSDPPDIFDRQIDFIQRAGIPMAMIGMLTVIPHTQLFRRLSREGRLAEDMAVNYAHDLRINFIPRMSREVLIEGYKRVLAELYSPGTYFQRCLTFLKLLPAEAKPSKPLSRNDIRAFLLSLMRQGFSRYGFKYLKFLISAIRLDTGQLAMAVILAIRGYHFFTITRYILKADKFSNILIHAVQSFQSRLAEVVEKGRGQLAAELESHIIALKSNMQKRYRKLSRGVQRYLTEPFAEFELRCETMLTELRLSYLYEL